MTKSSMQTNAVWGAMQRTVTVADDLEFNQIYLTNKVN